MAKGRKPPKPPTDGGGSNSVEQVTGLTATIVYSNNIKLNWNPVTNAQAYWIYRNGVVLAIITITEFNDATISGSGIYKYEVAAVVNTVLGPKSVSATVVI